MQEHFIYLFFFLQKWLQIYFIMQSHWNFKQRLVHWSWCRLCMCNIWIYAFYEGMPWPHLVVHHLDLYVLRLIADREIRRESYLILRVVSGPQHCALYLPFWHLAFLLRHCNAFVSTPQEDDVSGNLEFEKSKEPKHIRHLGHIVQCKLSSNGWISLSSELLTVRSFSSLTRSGEQGPSFWSRARFLPGLWGAARGGPGVQDWTVIPPSLLRPPFPHLLSLSPHPTHTSLLPQGVFFPLVPS